MTTDINIAWSHPGRIRSDAFAALAGVSPIPASSGRTTEGRTRPEITRSLNRLT